MCREVYESTTRCKRFGSITRGVEETEGLGPHLPVLSEALTSRLVV